MSLLNKPLPTILRAFERGDTDHLYLAVKTPMIQMPDFLRKAYPETITLLLEDRSRIDNLKLTEDGFSVTLFFGGKPGYLVVPYFAVLHVAQREEQEVPEPEDRPDNVVSLDEYRRRKQRRGGSPTGGAA